MTVKAIDLFAGAGGFTLSAIDAGVEVLAAIEFNKAAANTYRKNFIEQDQLKIDLRAGEEFGDINNVDPTELRESLNLKIGELDLILGGPPCQGFSTHRINNSGVDDPRNKLLLRYFDFVAALQPKAFLVENVAGLLWARHADYLDKFLEMASEHNYTIQFCGLINAKDYGVPQNRKRVFILGTRNDIDMSELVFPPAPTHTKTGNGVVGKWKTASTVFEPLTSELIDKYIVEYFRPKTNLNDDEARFLLNSLEGGTAVTESDPMNFHMQPTPKMIKRFISTPLNGSREDSNTTLACHSNGYKGHKDVYGRIMIHLPGNTITTGCNNPSKGRFIHPWKNHGITIRHAARFQTFPDDFMFEGTSTEKAKQIGNAVPVKLGKVLIIGICTRLN